MSIVASPARGLAALPPTGSARIDRGRVDALAARVTAVAPREPMDVEKPFTGETLGRVARCEEEDVDRAVLEARAAQARWARASRRARGDPPALPRPGARPPGRGARPHPARDGKARRHAFEEVLDVAIVSRYYASTAARQLRRTAPRRAAVADRDLGGPPSAGVVGVIAPWNYPLTLGVSDAIPALIAGNAVVIKPDSQTPLTALWAHRAARGGGPAARAVAGRARAGARARAARSSTASTS